jgi:membrane protein DedA with SNARE-associated domain
VGRIAAALQEWGPLGAFLLAALDSAGVPLPASVDVLLIAVGAASPASAVLSAGLAILGSACGSMFLFSVARKGGQVYLERHAGSARALRFRDWFARYGLATVFVPALVPIIPLPLKVFVLSAGALGVAPLRFLATVVCARVIRYVGLALLGRELGAGAWPWLKSHSLDLGLFAILLFIALYALLRFVDSR